MRETEQFLNNSHALIRGFPFMEIRTIAGSRPGFRWSRPGHGPAITSLRSRAYSHEVAALPQCIATTAANGGLGATLCGSSASSSGERRGAAMLRHRCPGPNGPGTDERSVPRSVIQYLELRNGPAGMRSTHEGGGAGPRARGPVTTERGCDDCRTGCPAGWRRRRGGALAL